MVTFWMAIYIIVLIMITIFLPLAIFLYESDEEKPISQRIMYAI